MPNLHPCASLPPSTISLRQPLASPPARSCRYAAQMPLLDLKGPFADPTIANGRLIPNRMPKRRASARLLPLHLPTTHASSKTPASHTTAQCLNLILQCLPTPRVKGPGQYKDLPTKGCAQCCGSGQWMPASIKLLTSETACASRKNATQCPATTGPTPAMPQYICRPDLPVRQLIPMRRQGLRGLFAHITNAQRPYKSGRRGLLEADMVAINCSADRSPIPGNVATRTASNANKSAGVRPTGIYQRLTKATPTHQYPWHLVRQNAPTMLLAGRAGTSSHTTNGRRPPPGATNHHTQDTGWERLQVSPQHPASNSPPPQESHHPPDAPIPDLLPERLYAPTPVHCASRHGGPLPPTCTGANWATGVTCAAHLEIDCLTTGLHLIGWKFVRHGPTRGFGNGTQRRLIRLVIYFHHQSSTSYGNSERSDSNA